MRARLWLRRTGGLVARYNGPFNRSLASFRDSVRYLTTNPEDPRYVFSKPPSKTDPQRPNDGKYFFTSPDATNQEEYEDANVLGQAILQQRRRRRRQLLSIILLGTLGSILGYSVGYKALYLREQSFIPLFPASRVRKLSPRDQRRIDTGKVQILSQIRVLEQLSQHEMIKEDYGVPLHDANTNETPVVQDFSIWCEDQDPCVTGIVFEPNDGRPSSHQWYRVPFLFKWRLTHRPLSISQTVNSILNSIGLSMSDLFQVVAPEKVYGSYKYEFPIQDDNHSMHIWFLGEMKLDDDSLVVYKGKYHVDVKLEQIDLLRKENGKLVRYILYKEHEK